MDREEEGNGAHYKTYVRSELKKVLYWRNCPPSLIHIRQDLRTRSYLEIGSLQMEFQVS